jgi:hypothetical protein
MFIFKDWISDYKNKEVRIEVVEVRKRTASKERKSDENEKELGK